MKKSKQARPTLEPTYYEIPLTFERSAELGRLSAVFAQVDHLLNELLAYHFKIPFWMLQLTLEGATTGPRVNVLRKFAATIKDKAIREETENVCDAVNGLIDKRNHIVHGLWVFQIISAQKTVKPASMFGKQRILGR